MQKSGRDGSSDNVEVVGGESFMQILKKGFNTKSEKMQSKARGPCGHPEMAYVGDAGSQVS